MRSDDTDIKSNETNIEKNNGTKTEAVKENGKKKSSLSVTTILLIVMVSISGIVTVGTMVYFRVNVMGNIDQITGEGKKYDRYYALVTNDRSESYWNAAYNSMKKEGELNNVYVDKTGDNLPVEYTKEQLMEMAIDSKVDGIIYEADETVDSVVQINRAIAAGIPVVTVRTDAPTSARRSFVGVSYYNLGNEYGRLIIKAVTDNISERTAEDDSPVSVLILTDDNIQDTSQNVTVTAIKEAVARKPETCPEISINTAMIDNSGEFTTEESIRGLLYSTALPDIIVCLSETNTVIVYQTIVEMNKVGESIILGYDDSESTVNAVKKEIIYATITMDMNQLGKDCVDALDEYIEFKRVSDYYGVDYKIIDRDNAAGMESEAYYEQ
ncbi:MAG: substrate-binding domain-containing protein [Lachnospiraceae bacterium]|nr:substrate-binding domain-containing protein [Lachnospiraceae bacterium]